MRILYCAIDQTVPGTTGGSVHVLAVASGLAALGHDVHALVTPGDDPFPPARCTGFRCLRRSAHGSFAGSGRARCVASCPS